MFVDDKPEVERIEQKLRAILNSEDDLDFEDILNALVNVFTFQMALAAPIAARPSPGSCASASRKCSVPPINSRQPQGRASISISTKPPMLHRPPARPPDRQRARRRLRQQRYRQRVRDGRIVAPVPVDAATIDFLVRTRWLAECDADDRRKIGDAIARMLKDAA